MSFSNSDDDRVPEDPEKVLLKECIAAYEILLINRSRSQNCKSRNLCLFLFILFSF